MPHDSLPLRNRIAKVTSRLPAEDARAISRHLETVEKEGIVSIEQLIDVVADASVALPIREIACSLLAHVNEPRAGANLARAMEEEDDGPLWEAAKALIRIRAVDAAPTLVRVLKGGSATQQSAAAYALGWLSVPETIPAVRAAASNAQLDADVRGHAVEALGVMEAREAVPDLVALLSDGSPEVRYWAAYSLGQIGDAAAVPALERMAAEDDAVLPHDRSLEQEALDALALIRERLARPARRKRRDRSTSE
jgi:HEAT repeat protein